MKAKNDHNEKLQMQTNSNRIMNRDQKNNIKTVLKIQEIIHEIIRKSDIIRIQIMKSQNIIDQENYIRKIINISIIIKEVTRTKRLSE